MYSKQQHGLHNTVAFLTQHLPDEDSSISVPESESGALRHRIHIISCILLSVKNLAQKRHSAQYGM